MHPNQQLVSLHRRRINTTPRRRQRYAARSATKWFLHGSRRKNALRRHLIRHIVRINLHRRITSFRGLRWCLFRWAHLLDKLIPVTGYQSVTEMGICVKIALTFRVFDIQR